MVVQATLILLYLRKMRSADPFRRTITGISVETGIPYSGVYRILEELGGRKLVEPSGVVGFSRRKSYVYRLTEEGGETARLAVDHLRGEIVHLDRQGEHPSDLTLADALMNPPAWFPLRMNDLAEHLKASSKITDDDLAYWRSFAALHRALLHGAARRFGERWVVDSRSLATAAKCTPQVVLDVVRQLKQEGVFKIEKNGRHPKPSVSVCVDRQSYLQWLARQAPGRPAERLEAGAKEAPKVLSLPEMCEAARRWVSVNRNLSFEVLRIVARPEDAHGALVLEDRQSGFRYAVRFGPDGQISELPPRGANPFPKRQS